MLGSRHARGACTAETVPACSHLPCLPEGQGHGKGMRPEVLSKYRLREVAENVGVQPFPGGFCEGG